MKNETEATQKGFRHFLVSKRIFRCGVLCIVLLVTFYWMSGISETERREIFRGVVLTVEDPKLSSECDGEVMIVEVQWDFPGVRIANRPYSFSQRPFEEDPLYRLEFADLAMLRHQASVLVNTTHYEPGEWYLSYPGAHVTSVETLVVQGEVSHVHSNSHLF